MVNALQGTVACIELDIEKCAANCSVLLEEMASVVQLTYSNQQLIVSTTLRSVIYSFQDGSNLNQIGNQERKCPGPFGATWANARKHDSEVWAARPRGKLWQADVKGTVQRTIIFSRPTLEKALSDVPIRILPEHCAPIEAQHFHPEAVQFGPLLVYEKDFLITWNSYAMFVLAPGQGKVAAASCQLGSIRQVVVAEDRVYVLRDAVEPLVICLSTKSPLPKNLIIFDKNFDHSAELLPHSAKLLRPDIHASEIAPLPRDEASMISDAVDSGSARFNLKNFLNRLPLNDTTRAAVFGTEKHNKNENTAIELATEAVTALDNVPPIVYLKSDELKSLVTATDTIDIRPPAQFSEVSMEESLGVTIARHKKRKVKSKVTLSSNNRNLQSDCSSIRSDRSHDSLVELNQRSTEGKMSTELSANSLVEFNQRSTDGGISTELSANSLVELNQRSTEGGISTELSANSLVELNQRSTEGGISTELSANSLVESQSTEEKFYISCSSTNSEIASMQQMSFELSDEVVRNEGYFSSQYNLSNVSLMTEIDAAACDKDSGKSKPPPLSLEDIYSRQERANIDIDDSLLSHEADKCLKKSSSVEKSGCTTPYFTNSMLCSTDKWMVHQTPAKIASFAVSSSRVYCTNVAGDLYCAIAAPHLVWKLLASNCAHKVVVSVSGSQLWCVHRGILYRCTNSAASTVGSEQIAWLKMGGLQGAIRLLAVDEETLVVVTDAEKVQVQESIDELEVTCTLLSPNTLHFPPLSHGEVITEIALSKGVLWLLTNKGNILSRTLHSSQGSTSAGWTGVVLPLKAHFLPCCVALDSKGRGWILECGGANLWFRENVRPVQSEGSGEWFQVIMTDVLGGLISSTQANTVNSGARHNQMRALASLATRPARAAAALASYYAGRTNDNAPGFLMEASSGTGLRVLSTSRNLLYEAQGMLLGHHWQVWAPDVMPTNSCWSSLTVCTVENILYAWCLHTASGEIFCLWKDGFRSLPLTSSAGMPKILTATQDAVWVLTKSNQLFYRHGVSSHNPFGTRWLKVGSSDSAAGGVDTSIKVLNTITAAPHGLLATDGAGGLFFRPPLSSSAVWSPVAVAKAGVGAFTAATGTQGQWWLADQRGYAFVRVGAEWSYVPGCKVITLSVTRDLVWALEQGGGLQVRCGTSLEKPEGEFWRRLPGSLNELAVTDDNRALGICSDSNTIVCHRICTAEVGNVHDDVIQETAESPSKSVSLSEPEWEII